MVRHIRLVHEGERRYPCKFCGRRFGLGIDKKRHEMRHIMTDPSLASIHISHIHSVATSESPEQS